MSVVIAIPARFASSRFPGKPLAPLKGARGQSRSLIRRAWEAACKVEGVDRVFVATDDERIRAEAEGFGAEVAMTPAECRNGTERCAALLDQLAEEPEIIVNLQGDAPLTPPWFVEALIADLRAHPEAQTATPVLRCDGASLASLRADRAAGRVGGTTAVFGANRRAIYFSKEVIPFAAGDFGPDEPSPIFHHVGVYAYRPAALRAYAGWPVSDLEMLEGLEQLRFLDHGTAMLCTEVEARRHPFWELNNPEDVPKIEAMLRQLGLD